MYKWHRCILELHGQKLVLIVDHEAPVVTYELFSSHVFSPRSFTFIGNLPVQYRSFDMLSNAFIFEGFRGAIQKVQKQKSFFLQNIQFLDLDYSK